MIRLTTIYSGPGNNALEMQGRPKRALSPLSAYAHRDESAYYMQTSETVLTSPFTIDAPMYEAHLIRADAGFQSSRFKFDTQWHNLNQQDNMIHVRMIKLSR